MQPEPISTPPDSSPGERFETIDQAVTVRFQYPVLFTRGVFDAANPALARVMGAGADGGAPRAIAILDGGLAAAWPGLAGAIEAKGGEGGAFQLAGAPIIVPGGEAAKNDPALVERIHRAIADARLDRHAYVIAVGGGAAIDLAGYAAATAHRGIRLVRVPTTVLAQSDASIGVKNGVNAFGRKNFLGTFTPPRAVINDYDFLATLDGRDVRAGIAESIKVAIVKDAGFFGWLEANVGSLAGRDAAALETMIHRCARLHLEHIATGGDPFEFGASRPLDFGHWAAHKLEQLTGYEVRHGEAVAMGMALDAAYAAGEAMLEASDFERIVGLIRDAGLAIFHPAMTEGLEERAGARCLLGGLDEFREHLGGRLTVLLPAAIGRTVEVNEIDEGRMIAAVHRLAEMAG